MSLPENTFSSLRLLHAITADDGATVQELAGVTSGLASHSLAVITHPPGTAARAHHHTVADEVYFVSSGQGRVSVEDVERSLQPGDIVQIRPGQRHKVWNDGVDDLVLIVSCAPAYDVREVVWDEEA